jgi:hypothetical protein
VEIPSAVSMSKISLTVFLKQALIMAAIFINGSEKRALTGP